MSEYMLVRMPRICGKCSSLMDILVCLPGSTPSRVMVAVALGIMGYLSVAYVQPTTPLSVCQESSSCTSSPMSTSVPPSVQLNNEVSASSSKLLNCKIFRCSSHSTTPS